MKLLLGDCLDKLKELDDNSVDSIVTDPPYGLSFMGKKWDYDVPSVEIWKECLRVLKPGGHLLSFAGSRTYHRMAVRIEDAGFEIRDQIMWIYGSGFPKSLNIGKSLESQLVNGSSRYSGKKMETEDEVGIPGSQWKEAGDRTMAEGEDAWSGKSVKVSNPIAKEWNGWGTALKPAHEPIVMARKPISQTVAQNVLEWGTGGINIDGCRIDFVSEEDRAESTGKNQHADYGSTMGQNQIYGDYSMLEPQNYNPTGRFPANVIFDEEAGKVLDEQSGISKSSDTKRNRNTIGMFGMPNDNTTEYNDKGGASRFFYCPKTSKKDRDEGLSSFQTKQTAGGGGGIGDYENDVNSASGKFGSEKAPSKNFHPTVKPTDLMGYLIRLVTKKGGIVLDPFMGSGSTGKAAMREGMDFVGIEREKEYYEIAEARIQNALNKPTTSKPKQTKVEPEIINKFFSF